MKQKVNLGIQFSSEEDGADVKQKVRCRGDKLDSKVLRLVALGAGAASTHRSECGFSSSFIFVVV
jgi:hypothetical protein